jgi:16S rRNA (cytidine1402-2'-O)-methyltransferase
MDGENLSEPLPAALYLVATPIGNLDDLTVRAGKILAAANLVLAEDTRRTRKLLNHLGVRRPMRSLHEHNERQLLDELVGRLASGESMALVSDAGTPLLSDPGFPLVRAALDAGIDVVPIPGASSLLAALTASGLPTDRFLFVGYLPRKSGARTTLLESLADEPGTLVFLESPRRLARSLAAAAEVFGARPVSVARELTKVHEEFIRGTLPEVAARLADAELRGEITVCLAGFGYRLEDSDASPDDRRERVASLDGAELSRRFQGLLAAGTPRNEALKQLAREHDLPRREIYKLLMIEPEETP